MLLLLPVLLVLVLVLVLVLLVLVLLVLLVLLLLYRPTWMRRSSCRRVAFHTRMSATEQVMKRSEQSAGNMMSFTRAK